MLSRRPSVEFRSSAVTAFLAAIGLCAAAHVEAQEASAPKPPTSETPAATEAPESTAPALPPATGDEPMVDNSWFSMGWPKVEMPEFSWKPWEGSVPSDQTSKMPSENPVSQALDRVADSSKKAASSVRDAWGSAMNKFSSFGASTKEAKPQEEAIAKSDGQGFFSRFFGKDDKEPAPQTVSEFLAQERGKTTLK